MSVQITVRLPDELAAYVDELVRAGAGPRAAIVCEALSLHQQRRRAEADARILEESGDYDDFDDLVKHASLDA